MKYTKILIVTILFFFWSQILFAGIVPLHRAESAGIQFLKNIKPELNINSFSESFVFNENGENVFYIFNFNSGFIIVSAESSVYPILGFSFEKPFMKINQPPAFTWWLEGYKQQIVYNIENKVVPSKVIELAWAKISSKNSHPKEFYETVEPLLNTTWNQGCYYNSALPVDSSGSCYHPYTGCVATALGQILKYYNYPKTGSGSHGINTPYGWLEVSFEDTEYDWVTMENNLTENNPGVAELLLHCVVAVNSQFLPGGTGAYEINARNALANYFDYDEDVQFLLRNSYPGDWEQMLRDELDQGRPVIYGGVEQSTSYGHTFICDGYLDTAFFHINWGWGGLYNGYFYIDSLVGGNYHFDSFHDAIIGIKPNIPESLDLYPVVNLASQTEDRDVTLSWEAPTFTATLELIGYHIFRNDTLLNGSIISNLMFIDENAPPGNHEYTVRTSYIGKNMGPSATTEVYVSGVSESFTNFISVFPNPVVSQLNIQFLTSINKNL
ncbi:MAG: C10 family peptidase, partial [Bacteroidales bacterium]